MGIMEKIRGALANSNQEEGQEIDDEQTRDNRLRGLRRQRRVQLEGEEKEQLMKDIKEHEREMTRRNVFGFSDSQDRDERIENLKKRIIQKRKSINLNKEQKLFTGNSFMVESKSKIKKSKVSKSMFL